MSQCPFTSNDENVWMEHVASCTWSKLQTCAHCENSEGWGNSVREHERQCGVKPESKRTKRAGHEMKRPSYMVYAHNTRILQDHFQEDIDGNCIFSALQCIARGSALIRKAKE